MDAIFFLLVGIAILLFVMFAGRAAVNDLRTKPFVAPVKSDLDKLLARAAKRQGVDLDE
jgi:hypothetical protein